MVSIRNNTNNDRMADEQFALIKALKAQMEELQQKGIADQLRNEESGVRTRRRCSLLRSRIKT